MISCAWAPKRTSMALLGPPKGPFGPRKALLGAPEGLGVPWGACFWPNCHWLVQRDDPHPYHVLGPLNGPLWHFWGPRRASQCSGGPVFGPTVTGWSNGMTR